MKKPTNDFGESYFEDPEYMEQIIADFLEVYFNDTEYDVDVPVLAKHLSKQLIKKGVYYAN